MKQRSASPSRGVNNDISDDCGDHDPCVAVGGAVTNGEKGRLGHHHMTNHAPDPGAASQPAPTRFGFSSQKRLSQYLVHGLSDHFTSLDFPRCSADFDFNLLQALTMATISDIYVDHFG